VGAAGHERRGRARERPQELELIGSRLQSRWERREGPPGAPPAVSQRWGAAGAGGGVGLAWLRQLPGTCRRGNGASLHPAVVGLRSGRIALLRLRSGQALERSICGDGCRQGRVGRVGRRLAGSALPLLLPVCTDRDRLCAVSCSASPYRQSAQAPRRARPPPCVSWSITRCTPPSASRVSTRPSQLGSRAEPGTRDAWMDWPRLPRKLLMWWVDGLTHLADAAEPEDRHTPSTPRGETHSPRTRAPANRLHPAGLVIPAIHPSLVGVAVPRARLTECDRHRPLSRHRMIDLASI
jgi:hypothetical protein